MSETNIQTSENESPDTSHKSAGGSSKYLFWLTIILILALVGSFLAFVRLTEKGMELTKGTILEMFHTYRPQKVIANFNEYRDLKVQGNEGNILEVATGEEMVELTRQDSVKILGKVVPKVKTVSRINVPANFRYHIDLKGEWELIPDGNRLHVMAPSLQPSLPVAFDTQQMEKTNPGWMRYVSGNNMDELERSITPELAKRAEDIEQIKQYRDEARKSIANFIRTWLIGENQWAEGKVEEIIVYFEGEVVDTTNREKSPDAAVTVPDAPPVEEPVSSEGY